MTLLQALKIVPSKRPTQLSPIQHRRNKLISKLHQQLECAKAKTEGRECTFARLRTTKNKETGQWFQMEQQYRIKPWWYTNDEGKTVIEVDGADKLVETIELLKRAVEAGELDEGITALVDAFGRSIKK